MSARWRRIRKAHARASRRLLQGRATSRVYLGHELLCWALDRLDVHRA